MFLSILLLLVAIAISTVAAYYSIIGLVTIFAAAVLPTAIMASVLEVAKVLTAAWLAENWKKVNFFLKSYLTFAVIVLMLITSLGIFGFLSKAHIQQTSNAKENVAQIETVITKIENNDNIIADSQAEIAKIENSVSVRNDEINAEIKREEERVRQAVADYQLLVDEQNEIINGARKNLDLLEKYLAENDVVAMQSLVGTNPDGKYGPATAKKVDEFRTQEEERVGELIASARNRVNELRDNQREERNKSTELINRLKSQIGVLELSASQLSQIEILKNKIRTSTEETQVLNEEKIELEKSYRELEAEVGPIRYVAEVVYDDVNETVLEDAVRFVILCLIFVFDPLAVLLVIASSQSIRYYRRLKKGENITHLSEEEFKEPEVDMKIDFKKKPAAHDTIENWSREKLKDHDNLE